ncbi:MAG: glycosyltransferase family 4 protein [Anaerolineales bacterium]|nr:glycosyltransferase family 4 protein [Anaerolineales bacterium]
MRLLIVSHMPHYIRDRQIVGWGPTAQEIDYLAQFFDEVRHIAWLHPDLPPSSSLPYKGKNIHLIPVPPSGGNSLFKKINILQRFPSYLRVINCEMEKADVIHVRAPANISLLAMVLLAFKRRPAYRWVKYAGNWQPEIPNSWSYAFQRWWLNKNFHHGVVSINGQWKGQAKHIYSFLNPCLEEDDISWGQRAGIDKGINLPLRLLFVGVMATFKGGGRVLQIAKLLQQRAVPFILDMVGDGPERKEFATQSVELGLQDQVRFHGWQPKHVLSKFYSSAHFILLPSATEGWPKVLSEGMAYGTVPLAGAVSSIPQILRESGAGLCFPFEDTTAFANAVEMFLEYPHRWKFASLAGMEYASRFTYHTYLESVKDMFRSAWALDIDEPAPRTLEGPS